MKFSRAAAALVIAATAACGESADPPTEPSPPATYRVTIGSAGATGPTELVVPPGTRVLFTNNHNVPHEITSDPHPEHDGCREINQVGVLMPGQTRETGNLVAPGTCSYHDEAGFMNTAMHGRIVVR